MLVFGDAGAVLFDGDVVYIYADSIVDGVGGVVSVGYGGGRGVDHI